MDLDENMVTDSGGEGQEDLALPEDIVEEQEEPAQSLESVMDDDGDGGSADGQKQQGETQGTGGEPGWFRKRWDKEVGKLTEQIRAEVRNEYESQFAPMRERLMDMEAQDLVKSGQVKSLDLAKEIVRLRQGLPPIQKQDAVTANQAQPRQANGQFAPRNEQPQTDPVLQRQIDMLAHQADTIKETMGLDVIKVFREDPHINQAVKEGRMDFYDVAREMQKPKKKPPAPMRSPNGASGMNPNAIDTMSDEAFDRMEKRIKEGARYSLRM